MFDKSLITDNRLASAKKKDMTPLKLDYENRSGIFPASDGGMYDTTLNECTCMDFARQGCAQPCKHMLRLAMELHEIPSDGMQSDSEAAKVKYQLGIARDFVQFSDTLSFIPFAAAFSSMIHSGKRTKNEQIFLEVLEISSIEECPLFVLMKNGHVKINKKFSKECTSLETTISHRLGNIVMWRLDNEKFATSFASLKFGPELYVEQ